MLKALTALLIAIVLGTTLASAGPPEGRYRVTGNNPGSGSAYAGTVTVERTGETFRVVWQIASQTFQGTGIGSDKGLAVPYRSSDFNGLASYGADGDGWDGAWTVTDDRALSTEKWLRE
jgi:hypothetical protein